MKQVLLDMVLVEGEEEEDTWRKRKGDIVVNLFVKGFEALS